MAFERSDTVQRLVEGTVRKAQRYVALRLPQGEVLEMLNILGIGTEVSSTTVKEISESERKARQVPSARRHSKPHAIGSQRIGV